ncbi:MAG TPA: ABC transporter ATP-binding protein [Acidimicrobiales bacterium]|nr:ABC transporter ATP-binding protein [Acidimicrobiales bacterium]
MTAVTTGPRRRGAAAGGERVHVDGATKSFGEKHALAGLHLQVDPGTFVVLLGPSGSGKTTLLRCVAGIERLTGGMIAIGEEVVASPGRHLPPEKRRLAMVFQDYALWPHMTALRNVSFPLQQLRMGAPEVRQKALEMLEQVGLARLADRYPNELSGGEQQRVALARALVSGVGLLLFDEPLSNLDADMREQLRFAISTLARDSGATSLYITHDQSEAFALADRVGVLRDGRLVQWGTPEELYLRPSSPFVARFTGICAEMPVVHAGRPSSGPRDQVLVRLAGANGAEVGAVLPRPLPASTDLQMFVRPSAVEIVPPAEAHFVAEVRDVAFAGRGYEHALSAEGLVIFTRVFSHQRWGRGTSVGVRLSPEGCLVLPADGSSLPSQPPPGPAS